MESASRDSARLRTSIGRPVVAILLAAPLLFACVVTMPTADEFRSAAQEKYAEGDKEAAKKFAALQRTWYGDLVYTVYARTPSGGVAWKDSVNLERAQQLIDPIARGVNRAIRQHTNDDELARLLKTGRGRQRAISVKIVTEGELVHPDCAARQVVIPVKFFARLSSHVLSTREPSVLEEINDDFASRLVGKDLSQDHLKESYAATLLGPVPTGIGVKELRVGLGFESAAIWNSLAFIVGHEAAHILADQCAVSADKEVQQERELVADMLGVMLALEAFSIQCGSQASFDSRRLADSARGVERKAETPEEEAVEYLTAKVSASSYTQDGRSISGAEVVTGMSGLGLMLDSIARFVGNDSQHPEERLRKILDENIRNEFVTQRLESDIRKANRSILMKLITSLSDLTIADIIVNGADTFSPEPAFRDGHACFKLEFEDAENDNDDWL